ncbi:hypothetical protein E2320_007142, partial [Naja naja]
AQTEACPEGTYGIRKGLRSLQECIPCRAGFFCAIPGQTAPSGRCEAGFYCWRKAVSSVIAPSGPCKPGYFCTGSARTATQMMAKEGHYALEGAFQPEPCPPGTFQPILCMALDQGPVNNAQRACTVASLAWWHLKDFASQTGPPFGGLCPAGHYCPAGTKDPREMPCPVGTWNEQKGGQDSTWCRLCPPGYFCSSPGRVSPTGPCAPVKNDLMQLISPLFSGFYCRGGTRAARPMDRVTGDLCPEGHFCPVGSAVPSPCRDGEYSAITAALHAHLGITALLLAFWRPPDPVWLATTAYLEPLHLPQQDFQNKEDFVPWVTIVQREPANLFPALQELTIISPHSLFVPFVQRVTTALKTPPVMTVFHVLLAFIVLKEPDMPSSFHALGAIITQTPWHKAWTAAYPAFQDTTQQPLGQNVLLDPTVRKGVLSPFCAHQDFTVMHQVKRHLGIGPEKVYQLQAVNALLGFTALEGLLLPSHLMGLPATSVLRGHIAGPSQIDLAKVLFLTVNSALLVSNFNSLLLVSGYYCDSQEGPVSNYTLYPCPQGHYCPPGTQRSTQYSCPMGTFGAKPRLTSILECQNCPPGKYCSSPGLAGPTGDCAAGFWCKGGAHVPNPTDGVSGQPCPAGHYCLSGTATSPSVWLLQMSLLLWSNGPVITLLLGALIPLTCPAGKWSGDDGNPDLQSCKSCPGGFIALQDLPLQDPLMGFQVPPVLKVTTVPQAVKPQLPVFLAPTWQRPMEKNSAPCVQKGSIVYLVICHSYVPKFRLAHALLAITVQGVLLFPILVRWEHSLLNRGYIQRYFCLQNSSSLVNSQCPVGHYCPPGTRSENQFPCPQGTYNPNIGISNLSLCLPCTPGHYCGFPGQAQVTGPCSAGYYCMAGASIPTPMKDLLGNICPRGHYCPKRSATPQPCPLGFYSNSTGNTKMEDCLLCRAAHFILPFNSHQPPILKTLLNFCFFAGYFCDGTGLVSPAGLCDLGFYCSGGAISPRPDLVTSKGGRCPPGHYCVMGSDRPQPCPAGNYNPFWGLDQCLDCPEGAYCDIGHYCPKNTKFRTQFPCPRGTYSEVLGIRTAAECQLCPSGKFCSKPGSFCPEASSVPILCSPGFHCASSELAAPSGPCDPGFYCTGGSTLPNPTDGIMGDICPQGYFCPQGTSSPVPCPAGLSSVLSRLVLFPSGPNLPREFVYRRLVLSRGTIFVLLVTIVPKGVQNLSCVLLVNIKMKWAKVCAKSALQERGGNENENRLNIVGLIDRFCDPSFQTRDPRNSRRTSPGVINPMDCLPGYYCLSGTKTAKQYPCPAGTFSNQTSLSSFRECEPCPGGKFCARPGLVTPSGPCLPGYYCVLRAWRPNPVEDETGSLCPAGHFCPLSSNRPIPCPKGTFLPLPGMLSQNACLPCPGGSFCQGEGLASISGTCQAGFYCDLSSSRPDQNLCPPGFYCPQGTGTPVPCMPGTINPHSGKWDITDCKLCPAGNFCSGAGKTAPEGRCSPGFYCPPGQVSSTPSSHRCPRGFYCLEGSVEPVACEKGTYQSEEGKESCNPCPARFFCEPTNDRNDICPRGHFCPPGTGFPMPCPPGSFSTMIGLKAEGECLPCPAGHICSNSVPCPNDGIHGYRCPKGFYCPQGASSEVPCEPGMFSPTDGASVCLPCPAGTACRHAATVEPAICPHGYYCPAETAMPIPCPAGLLNALEGASSFNACKPCPVGRYCRGDANWKPDAMGLSSPTGPCTAGFYCPANFSSFSPTAFLCPEGHFCLPGAAHPTPCPTGEYQPIRGSAHCLPCQSGFYCPEASPGEPKQCPPYFYCPEGTLVPLPCPDGTFTFPDASGLRKERDCLPCSPGHYCRRGQMEGPCAAGFFCQEGSSDATPQGFYCPEGSTAPIPCPDDTIGSHPGAKQKEDCLSCPPGRWCKTRFPMAFPCPFGSNCQGMNLTNPLGPWTLQQCPKQTFRTEFETEGQPNYQLCMSECQCPPAGDTTVREYPCAPGHWCPSRKEAFLCPPGSYRTQPGAISLEDCLPCPPGFVCPDPEKSGMPNVLGLPCEAGYECPLGSSHPFQMPPWLSVWPPYRNATSVSSWCVYPYYCPPGSAQPQLCQAGYVALNVSGLRDSSEKCCRACDAGTYKNGLDSHPPCLPCPAGFSCPPASRQWKIWESLGGCRAPGYNYIVSLIFISFLPQSGTASFLQHPCPQGHFCPPQTSSPVPCPPGTYGNSSLAKYLEECSLCPAGFFNHIPAQTGCFPCGSSSTSREGVLVNPLLNFFFLLFLLLFHFFLSPSFPPSSSSQIEERCAPGQIRLASTRKCVIPELYNCSLIYVIVSSTSLLKSSEIPNVLGPDHHIEEIQQVHLTVFGPSGILGFLPSNPDMIDVFLSGDSQSRFRRDTSRQHLPTIPNPVVCLMIGLLATILSTRRSIFTITTPTGILVHSEGWTTSSERPSSTFPEPGTYVFRDNAVESRMLIVVVNEQSLGCDPHSTSFQPSSPYQLARHGVLKHQVVNIAPDWPTIASLPAALQTQ